MNVVHLLTNFALQSCRGPHFSQVLAQDRGFVALVEAGVYPASGVVRVASLLPGRHYRLRGAVDGYLRADPNGSARIRVAIAGPILLTITALI